MNRTSRGGGHFSHRYVKNNLERSIMEQPGFLRNSGANTKITANQPNLSMIFSLESMSGERQGDDVENAGWKIRKQDL